MKIKLYSIKQCIVTCLLFFSLHTVTSQIIISQYYEGTGTNRWIELTNMGSTSINTASPQLKLGIWTKSGTTGTIAFSGSPTATLNLNVVIPAYSSVLIGNTTNGTEVSYLTAASASQSDNVVMAYNGNDGIALLNSSNTVLDRFGNGINATDISYVRNNNVLTPTATFSTSQWTSVSLSAVNLASTTSPTRLKYHIAAPCATPASQPSALLFGTPTNTTASGSFSPTAASGYLVVYSTSAALSALPVNGTSYSAGVTLGNARVVSSSSATAFSITGLTASTTYYVSVFAYNNTSCSGGPNYRTSTPLNGSFTTDLNPCATPASQPSALLFGTPTNTTASGSFSPTVASGYLVVYSTSATLSALPVNGTSYSAGATLGNATVVSSGTTTAFGLSGLTASTSYYVSVFAYNNTSCSGGPNYRTSTPLNGSFTTDLNPCATPASQPSALLFGTPTNTTASGSFSPTVASGYLVVYSTSAALSALPVNGTSYSVGATLGNATVVSSGTTTAFGLSGLTASTSYYVSVFTYNNTSCSGGPNYRTSTPLNGSFTTDFNACIAPSSLPSNLVFSAATPSSVSGSFSSTVADGYLVVYSASPSLSAMPVNGTSYSVNTLLGNATVVSSGAATTFSLNGLAANSSYYVSVFAYNNANCIGGPIYTNTFLSAFFMTTTDSCSVPIDQPTALTFTNTTSTSITGSFVTSAADGYLVVYSTSATPTENPVNGTTYTSGMPLGNATVIKADANTTFATAGLTATTTYYVFVYSYNHINCSGGPAYNTVSPLSASITTSQASLYYYFGNFHSHSEYSDGTGLPSGDFAFGDTSNCMDFLGISEHNHVGAGMSLNNYALGLSQAAAATTPSFLAMYGMEWGVISSGGHAVVYGVDKLIGWDPGQYDIYVPQTNYTGNSGLFNVINSYSSSNAFATLAHPTNSDYNGIMSTYDSGADDAIVGSAVENGPSTSANITYSDPPASMAYLSFYRNMLARGYHLGPTIDHDNHNVTHGHTATSRTVVLANSLTQNDVLGAMRAMRFYASQDCNAYVNFTINNQPLGSIIMNAGVPTITVTTSTTNPVTSLKIYSGIAGSGTNATILTSTTSGSITYSHTGLSNLSSRYYYIDITESDGKRIVTAPIWYSRNDAARKSNGGNVTEFFTVAEPKRVVLKWRTTNERESQSFTVERSYDAIHFELIESTSGNGVATANYYTAVDESSQNNGIAYYRLTHYDAEHHVVFTDTKKVMRELMPKFQAVVYPNPVTDATTLHLENANGELVQLKIHDLTGKLVYSTELQTAVGDQEIKLPVQKLASGVYLLLAQSSGYFVKTKLTKL
ncbi:CehA/McbA family metallohydrolase [Flavobacterium luteum]|uniref:T9SS type A sorting domain-containing protein n=1 Tax=Flavobacterium luteum TaxID=2026654 RepID=A0A7J5ADF7_9FLAO|nr:CehA/McbA family metallohydrolase [Flavobacterium luteum]KAB1155604.1 T9SS type A sorting domain-containing protein [Flavobacterium luteum]